MARLLSTLMSAVVGVLLAGAAIYGVVSSQTAAPKHNPASAQIVDYGNR